MIFYFIVWIGIRNGVVYFNEFWYVCYKNVKKIFEIFFLMVICILKLGKLVLEDWIDLFIYRLFSIFFSLIENVNIFWNKILLICFYECM